MVLTNSIIVRLENENHFKHRKKAVKSHRSCRELQYRLRVLAKLADVSFWFCSVIMLCVSRSKKNAH